MEKSKWYVEWAGFTSEGDGNDICIMLEAIKWE